jgi:hypothetical protein
MTKLLFTACVALLLFGCQYSKEFSRPPADALRLGHATKQEILAIYGDAFRQETISVTETAPGVNATDAQVPLSVIRLLYLYRDPFDQGYAGAKEKRVTFDFANDRLFAYAFHSTFRTDRTNFDDRKVVHLENGKTTRGEVIELFGPPSGRAVFPAVPPGTELYSYAHSAPGPFNQLDKRLDILIGDDGVVRHFNLVREVSPTQRPVPTYVPVYIPRGK